jgi:YgiT-type zinc finger domain-containing protein
MTITITVNRCPKCQSDAEPVEGRAQLTKVIGGLTFVADDEPAHVCPQCGTAREFASDVLHRFDLRIAEWMAMHGEASPLALKFMRRVAGLTGAELAELLDTNAETVSRWENGKNEKAATSPANAAIYAALVLDRIDGTTNTRDRLREQRKRQARAGKPERIALRPETKLGVSRTVSFG